MKLSMCSWSAGVLELRFYSICRDIGDQLSSKIGVLSSDYLQENAGNIVVKAADLAALNASEEDKIQAMMFQSTVDYDPAK